MNENVNDRAPLRSDKGRKSSFSVFQLCAMALMAAVTCVLAPMSLPIGPVPITLTNLVIYLTVILLGWKMGTISYLIYMLLGLVGLPVFSGYTGGPGKLFGPTGGYIVGFIFLAIISGLVVEHFKGKYVLWFLGMVLGTAVLYAFGTAWFVILMGGEYTVWAALSVCVFPFIPGDIIKMVLAILIGIPVRKRLAGYLNG